MTRKIVDNFPNYTISKNGEVVNKHGVKIKPEKSNNGYMRVSLSNDKTKHKKFSVHRLVAEAFIPNPDNLPQVDHLDEDKTNNLVDNLRWCTPLENLEHSGVIDKASIAKFTKVRCIDTGVIYNSVKEAAEEYGVYHANIVACCNGRRNRCGGVGWEYV